jgi:hypothetical protein
MAAATNGHIEKMADLTKFYVFYAIYRVVQK